MPPPRESADLPHRAPVSAAPLPDRAIGVLLLIVTLLVAAFEWTGSASFETAAILASVPLLALLAPRVPRGRQVFLAIGLALVLAALALRADGLAIAGEALGRTAFIAAFFTALASLRAAAAGSVDIARCGRFLAAQPPGRRYAALTIGGQVFAMLLNYGAIVLLGGMAVESARGEQDEEIRRHRIRRMLLAVQRGLVSTLAWSPLAFAIAISTAVVPGADWASAAPYCIGTGVIIALTGWALDTAFKPRLSHPAPRRAPPEGGWGQIWPLLALLAVLAALVLLGHATTGVRTVGLVMVIVPVLSLLWVLIQHHESAERETPLHAALSDTAARSRAFTVADLPGYRAEIVLLMMAGLIGSAGGALAAPWMVASGIDLAALPAPVLLVAIVWIIPITGQLGMNPILTVSLAGPLLPPPEALGLEPDHLIAAITAGWALSGASSPFTATTVLVGNLGGVSAHHVGLRWNGPYTLLCACLLSAWILLVTSL
ncbi:MAG: hypothetical protein AAFP17_11915 [Pseudomonadota bacterium]